MFRISGNDTVWQTERVNTERLNGLRRFLCFFYVVWWMFRLKNIHNIKEEFHNPFKSIFTRQPAIINGFESYLCRVNETVCDIDTALPDTAEYTGRDSRFSVATLFRSWLASLAVGLRTLASQVRAQRHSRIACYIVFRQVLTLSVCQTVSFPDILNMA